MPYVELSRIAADPRRLADAVTYLTSAATPALAGANDTREAAGNT